MLFCNSIVGIPLLIALAPFAGACTTSVNYGPTTEDATVNEFRTTFVWKDVKPLGHLVYLATQVSLGSPVCSGGYFGAQFLPGGGSRLLFSMAHGKYAKIFPRHPNCKEDCFDCHWPKKDVQCSNTHFGSFSFGVEYNFRMYKVEETDEGAVWGVDVYDTSLKTTYEIGRMFFPEASTGLSPSRCRTLTLQTSSFEEYPASGEFSASATWSRQVFHGSTRGGRELPTGYCEGQKVDDINGGVTREACQQQCLQDPSCRFASYTNKGFAYSRDGMHCMLYSSCNSYSEYNAQNWVTYRKNNGAMVSEKLSTADPHRTWPAVSSPGCCFTGSRYGFRPHTENAFVASTNPFQLDFNAGMDVKCHPKSVEITEASEMSFPWPRPSLEEPSAEYTIQRWVVVAASAAVISSVGGVIVWFRARARSWPAGRIALQDPFLSS